LQGPASKASRLREALCGDIYAVLGNHDSIATVPDLEALGIRMLLNECVAIDRGSALIYLAGVDDAHVYRADNMKKRRRRFPSVMFLSCSRTLRRSTGRPRTLVSP
jgi:uncharacterized protein